MDVFSEAIVRGERTPVLVMLRAEPTLVQAEFREAELYEEFGHWIYEGDTYLHLAAAAHRAKIVVTLLAAGADPDLAGRRGGTSLHYAADGHPDSPNWDPGEQSATLRALLGAGAAKDAQDRNGATPLHRAVRTRCAAAVAILLDAGGNPGAHNRSGSTPFHLAVQNTGRGGTGSESARDAQREIIEAFLARGVSPDLTDGNDRSVMDSARSAWVRELLLAG